MTQPAQRTDSQPYPWVVPDLFRWFFLLLLSVAGLVIAWWGESGTARLSTQITYLNVGVVAVVLGGLGNSGSQCRARRCTTARAVPPSPASGRKSGRWRSTRKPDGVPADCAREFRRRE
jgi:hypothetical protein